MSIGPAKSPTIAERVAAAKDRVAKRREFQRLHEANNPNRRQITALCNQHGVSRKALKKTAKRSKWMRKEAQNAKEVQKTR